MIEIKSLASGSRGNCYWVSDGSTPLLLECGIRFKDIQRGLNFKVSNLAGCLITHEHKDHCKALKDMIKAGVDCYMSQGTAEVLGAVGHRARIVMPEEQFELGTWTVLPLDTQHDAAQPLGFLLHSRVAGERLLFATDTFYIKYRFSGLNYIMVECNYSADILQANEDAGLLPKGLRDRIVQSHFSLDNVKEFLRANDLSKVEEIWLIHLSDGNSDAERFKREIQELTGKMVLVA